MLIVNPILPHPTPDELAGYAARRLDAADVLRVSDHLDACGACREAAARLRVASRRQTGAYLDEPASESPTFQELADGIDGTLAPGQREALEARLDASPSAREAWADLAAFREELAAMPVKFHGPERSVAAIRSAPVADGRIITPPDWRWRRVAARVAGLAALLVVLAAGGWTLARSGRDPAALLRDAHGQRADLAALPADLRQAVETALQTGRLPPLPESVPVSGGREELAGDADRPSMTVVSPVGVVVRPSRPTLRWTPRPDATGYRVNLVRADGSPAASSPELPASQTQWTPEALPRGETYEWQVTALHDGKTIDRAPKPPAAEAFFRVLDAGQESELARVETRAVGYPLILGLAYWRAGIADDAATQFHQLTREHAQSAIAQQLERAADK